MSSSLSQCQPSIVRPAPQVTMVAVSSSISPAPVEQFTLSFTPVHSNQPACKLHLPHKTWRHHSLPSSSQCCGPAQLWCRHWILTDSCFRWYLPTITDYRGHCWTPFPVWEINLKACELVPIILGWITRLDLELNP